MISLSDNEFAVLNFLVRNFTERLTIRSIAQRLGFSSAGVFSILKKLEKSGIVSGQKLGTGLFYQVNFDNAIACHLAAVVLIYSEERLEKISVEPLKKARFALLDRKSLLLVTDNLTSFEASVPNVEINYKTEEEFAGLLKKKDQDALALLKKGVVLFGEGNLIEIIKGCISRL